MFPIHHHSPAEPLQKDMGKRFFNEYLHWLNNANPHQDMKNLCLCQACSLCLPINNNAATIVVNNDTNNDMDLTIGVCADDDINQQELNR
jgi:hypothetical protein